MYSERRGDQADSAYKEAQRDLENLREVGNVEGQAEGGLPAREASLRGPRRSLARSKEVCGESGVPAGCYSWRWLRYQIDLERRRHG